MKVELITKSEGVNSYDGKTYEEIIDFVARHGRTNDDKEPGALTNYLMRKGHWSPLEHIFFGFRITTSRAISAQIFRHRSMHFQELSQRYDVIPTHEHIEIRRQHKVNRQSSTDLFDPTISMAGMSGPASQMIDSCLHNVSILYKELVDAGVAKECARMILPMSSTTIIHVSGCFRDMLAFLNQRCDKHAQKEARDIAMAMGEAIEELMPQTMGLIDWRNGSFMYPQK